MVKLCSAGECLLVLVLLIFILEGSKKRGDPNSSVQTHREPPFPWPHSSPVSIGASQGIDGIYSCWVSGQQIYPCFYPLGLAPDMEQLWDIELLGTKSRGEKSEG